jgi:hypothetical protein
VTTTIEIDLNVRVGTNWTYAEYEDVDGPLPSVGDTVHVIESESGLRGEATVATLDRHKELVYLDVNWTSLR